MEKRVDQFTGKFGGKRGEKEHSEIRIFMQQPSQIAGLQAVDYVLWGIHRAYNHGDYRYYRYLQDKICLVHDLNHGTPYYGTYYTKRKPLTPERFL